MSHGSGPAAGTIPGLAVAAALLLPACDMSVNSPIVVRDGETRSGNLTTVNGSIEVGERCSVDGDCRTVNGTIEIGRETRVGSLKTVNGVIRLEESVRVDLDVESVNGTIRARPGTRVGGDVSTVNGPVELDGTEVAGDVRTVTGEIRLDERSVVKGNVVIEEPTVGFGGRNPMMIVLAGESTVNGDVINEDESLEVTVRLLDGSKVLGQVINARVVGE